MNNYNGVRTVGFLSLVFGAATLGVCGWLFLTYEFGDPTALLDDGCYPITKYNISAHQFSPISIQQSSSLSARQPRPWPKSIVCYKFLAHFLDLLFRNSFVASVTSLFQIVLSTYLIATTGKDAIQRAKYWTLLNIGFNLIYLMCFISPFTFPIPMELGRRNAALALSNIKYLPAYYIILGMDILLGFMMLIVTMIMIRLHNKFGYAIMANI